VHWHRLCYSIKSVLRLDGFFLGIFSQKAFSEPIDHLPRSKSSVSDFGFTGDAVNLKPMMPKHPYNLRYAVERFECEYVQNILVLTAGDKTQAAQMLGIRVRTLERKLQKYQAGDNFRKEHSTAGIAHEKDILFS
jgi:DNA-binding NtrC family response regulator